MTEDLAATHPRQRYHLTGVAVQARAIEEALERGRLHHAWLLAGPSGLGKASFAFRAARRLLGARAADHGGPLGSLPDDPVCRLIASQSHPDLIVLERTGDRRSIAVEEVRRLPEFFAKASGLGGRRVAILDSVDDLNANGANALLKTLEEPSENGVLLLISHSPGRLLRTIRSRCRTLPFRPEGGGDFSGELADAVADEDDDEEAALARSPGGAARSPRPAAGELQAAAEGMLSTERPLVRAEAARVAEGFKGPEGLNKFRMFSSFLGAAALRRALQAEGPSAARWSAFWSRCSALCEQVEGLNLDRADAFWTLAGEAAVLRASC
jgi:DNA polymerase-3 subunit delta'